MKDVALIHVKHLHIKEARLIISRFLKTLMYGNLTIILTISIDLTITHCIMFKQIRATSFLTKNLIWCMVST